MSKPSFSSIPKQSLQRVLVAFLSVLLSLVLLFPYSMQSAYATPTATEKQAEADEASAALAAAEEQAQQVTTDYFAAAAAYEEATAAMDEAQGRIDAAEAIIKETQEKLGKHANQMYRQGALSYLDVLFGASSFEEFTTSLDLINAINNENAKLIQTNKDARIEAEAAHEEYSAQQQIAADRLAETEAAMTRAEELVAEQLAVVETLSAEAAALLDQEQAARVEVIEQQAAASQTDGGGGGGGDQTDIVNYDPYVETEGYGDVVSAAYSRIGCPYVYGATGPNSFDCSGLTSWCYSQAGRGWIGRDTYAQYANASQRWAYTSGGASPGDVLWFTNMTHVAIYIGGGQYIHAPVPGQSVCISSWSIENTIVLRF